MSKTCIVVTCYNEEKRLNFLEFDKFVLNNENVDFLFCNDGSRDKTKELLDIYKSKFPNRILVYNMPNNSGKAEAVRCGILNAGQSNNYSYLGYWDADLATPLSEITHLTQQLIFNSKDFVMASRLKRLGATVERKASRHILGRIFSTFSSIILKLPVYDTQCGAKIFKAELLPLFEKKFLTSWIFDVELLARYRNTYGLGTVFKNVLEVPVNSWQEKTGSKLKLKDIIKIPLELLLINKKYN